MQETHLIDTNVLLRFLTGDPPKLADKARKIVAEADKGRVKLEILPLVISETIYTLESFYEISKNDVCKKLSLFLQCKGIVTRDHHIMLDAISRYRTNNVHFVDACLASYAADSSRSVYSFDKDFKKFKDITWRN